tara:strand:- start:435 stop:683 length:249 start_codon:yes stop_codon:yes gene_type:complete
MRPIGRLIIFSHLLQKDVVLSKKDMQMLLRVGEGKYPNEEFDPYFDTIETCEKNVIHPVLNSVPPKVISITCNHLSYMRMNI